MAPEFLTTGDLAELLNVPERTVRSWRARNVGPPGVRVVGAVRYRLSDVHEWIANQEQDETRVGVS